MPEEVEGQVTDPAPPRHAVPEDGFDSFGPAPQESPTRARRFATAAGRFLSHEWTLAALGALLLAAIMTWPTLRYPAYTIPQDVWDPTLQAWQMAWSGHALLHEPGQLWQSNTFFPDQYAFAYSDTLLGYSPFGMIGTGLQAALIRYNIMYFLIHALAFFGAYVLARQLGSGKTGAVVAGIAFAYAPWRLAQAGHMHVMSTGGIALALAMLARGHGWSLRHGYRPELRKPGWALAGWLVAAWQVSIGFGIGLPFGYVLGIIVLVCAVTMLVQKLRGQAKPFGWRLFAFDGIGMLVFGAVVILLALPYLKVKDLYHAERSPLDIAYFSPPLRGFFIAPAESLTWGSAHEAARATLQAPAEMTMLPGFVLYGLAFAGLIMSVWTLRRRILLGVGMVVSVCLAMGANFAADGRPGYMTLYDILPGWDAIRTPGRLVIWTTLLLGLLAAGAITSFTEQAQEFSADRVPSRPHPALRFGTLIPVVLVLVECLNQTPHPVVDLPPPSISAVQGPMLVLPSDQLRDENIMIWNTERFTTMVNGGSGYTPPTQAKIREVTKSFPDQASVGLLRELGVKTVVVLKQYAPGGPYEGALTATGDGLGIKREDRPDAVVFTLS